MYNKFNNRVTCDTQSKATQSALSSSLVLPLITNRNLLQNCAMAAPIKVTFKSVGELIGILILSFIFGLITFVSFVVEIIKKGPSRVFHVKERNVRPAILDGDEFGTHDFLRLKNSRVKLHYVANGGKNKPLMLFLHGFPEFWYSWRFQLKEFSQDYRVVAIDMRGYGESDKPSRVSDYYIEYLTNDVQEVISALGYKKCVLVAHDWGGAVAWMFALLHPDMVEKLVICNCPHPAAFEDHARSSLAQVLKSWYMFMFQVPVLPILVMRADDLAKLWGAFCGKDMGAKSGTFTEEDMNAYKYTYAQYVDFLAPINYYRAMMRYQLPSVRKAKISMPTLMIWGTKDGALDTKMAELTGRYVENYSLKLVEGASHWVQQEEPDRANEYMREFLREE